VSGFAGRYGPWAVVAGASNGIGLAFARALGARGCNVVLVSRDEQALHAAAREVEAAGAAETRICVTDLTSPDVATRVGAAIDDLDVGTLVYNAGAVHGAGRFHERPVDDALFLVDLNCRGPVLLAHLLAPRLVARGSGAIVLMSSMAALAGSGYVAAYSATKAFDINLAEGLAVELGPHGVDAMVVVAGATATPALFASGATVDPQQFVLMEPDDVATGALDALGTTSLWVAGDTNRANYEAMRTLPRAQITTFMTQGSASLYGLPPLG
jgi:short-subunit dehydrogenase